MIVLPICHLAVAMSAQVVGSCRKIAVMRLRATVAIFYGVSQVVTSGLSTYGSELILHMMFACTNTKTGQLQNLIKSDIKSM